MLTVLLFLPACGEKGESNPAKTPQESKDSLVVDQGPSIDEEKAEKARAVNRLPVRFDVEGIKEFLQSGADVNGRDEFDKTILHDLTIKRNVELMKLVLEAGADATLKDNVGNTALHYARTAGAAKLLISYGADVTAKNEWGQTPLHYTLNEEIVEVLIAHGADIEARSSSGSTPLMSAACSRNRDIGVLISKGADVNARDSYGRTPLHFAVLWGTRKEIDELVINGADLNAADKRGYTSLHAAIAGGFNAGPAPEKLKQLLMYRSVDINAKSSYGLTPLDMAVSRCGEEVVALLRKHGARHGKPHRIALTEAIKNGDTSKIKELIARGADVNARNLSGDTLLHVAVFREKAEAVRLLLGAGANPDVLNTKPAWDPPAAYSPLHWAAVENMTEIVKLLLDGGADINIPDSYGQTPLLMSVMQDTAMTVFLVAKGADVDKANLSGNTPLHEAVVGGKKGIVTLLLEKGAKINQKDRQSRTPLDVAEDEDMKKLLLKHGAKTGEELEKKDK